MSDAPRSWRDACAEFARDHGVSDDTLGLLAAFVGPEPRGGPPPPPEPPWAEDFDALERALLNSDAPQQIAAQLAGEVDEGQAQLFARRFIAVDMLLHALDDATGRVLRVGLRQRLRGVLDAPAPRALRVRALADFYYSQASRHHHQRAGAVGLEAAARVAELRWQEVTGGVERSELSGFDDNGPMHVNLLRIDPQQVTLRIADCRAVVSRQQRFAQWATEQRAVAATSGGFFLYSEPDIAAPSSRHDPVGLLVDAGRVLNPPVFARGALCLDRDGAVSIERMSLEGWRLRGDGREIGVARWHNRAHADRARGMAIVAGMVVAAGDDVAVPLNGVVVDSDALFAPGTSISWHPPEGRDLYAGIAGGPLLVEAGAINIDLRGEDFWRSAPPVTFSQDETGDRNLLPRLAAGIDDQGRLLLAAIDGRNLERALGMTLRGTAALMLALGCRQATNLDGGSSKRMVVQGETLDLHSTEIVASAARDALTSRPVYTALLVSARAARDDR